MSKPLPVLVATLTPSARTARLLAELQHPAIVRYVAHGFVGRPSPASFVREAQYGVRAAAERLPWPTVSHLPAKAMRRLDLWRGLR